MKKRFLYAAVIFSFIFCVTGCFSVFSGGTGGLIVDSESTSTPKTGIANVDVYAYTSAGDRNSDFDRWQEGTVFTPHASYYGHTTTGNNGNFTISKIVWKSGTPNFGKDADYTDIYFIFYHENYGIKKGATVIVSDSTTATVYAELTKVRKVTDLTLNLQDVATGANTNETIYVEVAVPQTTDSITDAEPKIYKADITGSGVISVSYPRWQNASDKENGIETKPDVVITYRQNADVITWQGCYNGNSASSDYSFNVNDKNETVVNKTINGKSYSVTLYGKKTKFNVPSFSGQWGLKNGVTLNLLRSANGSSYTIDCGSVETEALTLGTNGTQKNGCFSNLGLGKYWFDYSYTDKTSKGYYRIADGNSSIDREVPTDRAAVTIQKD